MSSEHEGVDRPPEAGRTDETAAADRVPPVAPREEPTAQLRRIDPNEEPPESPATSEPARPRPESGGPEGPERPGTPAPPAAPEQQPAAPAAADAPTTPIGPPVQPLPGPPGSADPWGATTPTGPPAHQPPPPQPLYGGGPAQPWGAPIPPPPPGKKRSGGLIAALLAAAIVAGGVGGGIGFWAAERNDSPGSETVSAPNNPEKVNRAPDSVAGIASKALPSVVTIQVNGGVGDGTGGGRGGGSTGTGFVFDKQGHILTNNHVVASAAEGGELTAVFADGEKHTAEVVGRAEGYDVAVIKLKNPGDAKLTPLPLGKSGEVAVGDATIAIGAPYGLDGTVTTGIVSALNRPVASSDGEGSSASYMSALQTDASINPGNSGGPLLNAEGAVIGINSAIQPAQDGLGGGSSGSIGLGFAIPIDQAKRVAQTLVETGRPVYPIIGATVEMNQQGSGATISEKAADGTSAVVKGGPADKAGLKSGDVITEMEDTTIDSGPTLISEIWTHKPGDKVEVTYERGGKKATTEITLGKRTGD